MFDSGQRAQSLVSRVLGVFGRTPRCLFEVFLPLRVLEVPAVVAVVCEGQAHAVRRTRFLSVEALQLALIVRDGRSVHGTGVPQNQVVALARDDVFGPVALTPQVHHTPAVSVIVRNKIPCNSNICE